MAVVVNKNVSVSQYDKYTVEMLKKAKTHLENKLTGEKKKEGTTDYSKSTVNKLNSMIGKYDMQIGKTINLYNKYSKHKATKNKLKGFSVSNLSVEKIYKLAGNKTRDGEIRAWFREEPGRILNVVGGGMALAGAVGMLRDTGLKTGIENLLKQMFGTLNAHQIGCLSLLGVGALLLVGGHLWNKAQKSNFKNAQLQQETIDAMNKGTVKDDKYVGKANDKAIEKLAGQASVDPELMEHLQDLIDNTSTDPTVAAKAQKILDAANIAKTDNERRVIGSNIQRFIESAAKGALVETSTKELNRKKTGYNEVKEEKDVSETLRNFAVAQKINELKEAVKARKMTVADAKKEFTSMVNAGLCSGTFDTPTIVTHEVVGTGKKAKTIIKTQTLEDAELSGKIAILDTLRKTLPECEYDWDDTKNAPNEASVTATYARLVAKYGENGITKAVKNIQEVQLGLGAKSGPAAGTP